MISISPQIAATLTLAFFGLVFGFGKVLLSQFDKRMEERMEAQDRLRESQLAEVISALAREAANVAALRARLEQISNALPLEYLRREDWIRFGSMIDHKLDKLHDAFLTIRGGNQ